MQKIKARMVARLLPKELLVRKDLVDELSDQEIADALDILRGSVARAGERAHETGVFGPALFARFYGSAENEVLFAPYDAGMAFKAMLPRRVPAGEVGDTDVYGAQQHAPLLEVEVPI